MKVKEFEIRPVNQKFCKEALDLGRGITLDWLDGFLSLLEH